jgi:cobalamin biosynthesis Co2+ chelatase CbiK
MEMMIKCLYLSLILFLIAWAVQAYDQTTDNLLSPNFTDGSWTGTNVDLRHGDQVIAGFDSGYVESSINLNDHLTKEEINGGFSSTLGADIWFWNSNTQNVIMKQTLIDDNGVSITQQRQIDGSCATWNGCDYSNYTDTIIVNGNSQQDYEITARFEFNESSNSTAHYGADLRNPSLTVSYYENFTQPEPIELDTKWKDTLEEEYKMDYVVEEFKLDDFIFLKEDTEMFILEETTEELDKEFEEVEILQAFGGPEIVEEPKEQEDKEIDSTVAIQDDAMEEIMEEQPEQTEETFVATDGQQLESEPSSNEQVAVDVQDVQTQVAVKIKAIDKQLAATNIIGAQLMEAQQVDLSSYNKSYTDNRKIYEGNTYEDLRTLDEYSKKIYNDNTKFVAISMNDPVRKYQEKLRDATIKRQMAERELRQLRGY